LPPAELPAPPPDMPPVAVLPPPLGVLGDSLLEEHPIASPTTRAHVNAPGTRGLQSIEGRWEAFRMVSSIWVEVTRRVLGLVSVAIEDRLPKRRPHPQFASPSPRLGLLSRLTDCLNVTLRYDCNVHLVAVDTTR
jgi:hypothetical protein